MGREDMNKATLNNYFSKSFAAKGSRAIGWYQMGKMISREKNMIGEVRKYLFI